MMHSKIASKPYKKWQILLIWVLPVLLYLNTFTAEYTLDDDIVIFQNAYTQQGTQAMDSILFYDSFMGFYRQKKNLVAGGRYRPLSILTFAMEVALLGPDPKPNLDAVSKPKINQTKATFSHIFNALFYAICCWLVFITLYELVKGSRIKDLKNTLPFIATLIFICHPIHTEAVANLKGRDELLCFIFAMLALLYAMRYYDRTEKNDLNLGGVFLAGRLNSPALLLVCSGLFFILSLLAKESSIPFLLVIPITIYFFRKIKTPQLLAVSFTLLACSALWFFLRSEAIGVTKAATSNSLMNESFLLAKGSEFGGTISVILGKYLLLLFAPIQLTYDYYPFHISYHSLFSPLSILSLLINLALAGLAVWGFIKRKFFAWGLIVYFAFILLVSNIFFEIGAFMAERFLFIPSLGFAFLLAYFISLKLKKLNLDSLTGFFKSLVLSHKIIGGGLIVLLLAYSIKTIDRNFDWHNNFSLFTTDVNISKNSAKGNCAAGGIYYDYAQWSKNPKQKKKYLNSSLKHLNKAIEIYPEFGLAYFIRGNVKFFLNGDIQAAINDYLKSGERDANENIYKVGLISMQKDKYKDAYTALSMVKGPQSNNFNFWIDLAKASVELGKFNEAESYLGKAGKLKPESPTYLSRMGELYARGYQDLNKAVSYFQSALAIDPKHKESMENLGITYAIAGQFDRSITYLLKSYQESPRDKKLLQNIITTYARMGDQENSRKFQEILNQL